MEEEAAAFWLIHQQEAVADMRNDAPLCTDTQREAERWGSRSPFITHSLPASPVNLCRGGETGPAWRGLLESWVPTGRLHISSVAAFPHQAFITPASPHLPLDSASPLFLQPLLLPAFMITEPKSQTDP